MVTERRGERLPKAHGVQLTSRSLKQNQVSFKVSGKETQENAAVTERHESGSADVQPVGGTQSAFLCERYE